MGGAGVARVDEDRGHNQSHDPSGPTVDASSHQSQRPSRGRTVAEEYLIQTSSG